MIGRSFGQYEIVDKLGAGGMGEVYRAHDRRLHRDVAIKVLPASLAADHERLARLEREAQLLAQLEHSNVAAIYGLEEAPGEGGDSAIRFLVMQLAEGATLEARLLGGPLPLDEAVPLAVQIADGLEAAHERGIVHRDLKPANVMVGSDGQVKILDFGLAKALGPETAAGTGSGARDLTASPTVMAATGIGVIMGTAAYMSPEQARGRPVDRRCDIWAFGCVLFETLTGARAFAGDTVTDIMAAIVTRDPDWNLLPDGTPGWLRGLLSRCLEKDPRQRLRDIGEARVQLQRGPSGADVVAGDAETTPVIVDRRGWMAAAVLAALAVATLIAAWGTQGGGPVDTLPRFVTLAEPGLTPLAGAQLMAVAPDGESIAFVARQGTATGVWIRRLDEPVAREVPGTSDVNAVFWSPDGQSLGFVEGSAVRALDLRSGAVTTSYSTDDPAAAAAWIPQERAQGITANFGSANAGVQLLGDGPEALLSIFMADHGHTDAVLVDADNTVLATVAEGPVGAVMATPDVLFTWRDGSVWAQRFDLAGRTPLGDPVALLLDIDIAPGQLPLISVGGDTLAYRAGGSMTGQTTMDLVDRTGQLIERVGDTAGYYSPRMSPDGLRIAYDLSDETNAGNIWVRELDGVTNRITSSAGDETRPVWSPDGSRLAMRAPSADGTQSVGVMPWNAPGTVMDLGAHTAPGVTDWTGEMLIADASREASLSTGPSSDGGFDIWILADDGSSARPYRDTAFDEFGGDVSPDGRWIAYTSNESGRQEVWIESFPEPGRRRRVSAAGGEMPAWRSDGRELFYIDSAEQLVAVPIPADSPLSFGTGTVLFSAPLRIHMMRQYDVSADGQSFLLNRRVEVDDEPIRLLINWRQELARRTGGDW